MAHTPIDLEVSRLEYILDDLRVQDLSEVLLDQGEFLLWSEGRHFGRVCTRIPSRRSSLALSRYLTLISGTSRDREYLAHRGVRGVSQAAEKKSCCDGQAVRRDGDEGLVSSAHFTSHEPSSDHMKQRIDNFVISEENSGSETEVWSAVASAVQYLFNF